MELLEFTGSEEWLVLLGTLDRSCCWLHGLLGSLRNVDQFDMSTLATSNTCSISKFLRPVLAVAIAWALIAAHRVRDVRSDIKSQLHRTYSSRRLWALRGFKIFRELCAMKITFC
ncbi:hypothetical protein PoB_001711400 [Plakobranchus ocellatus]|uniref:Uncharacterized protein n=1 Tax=Plakobranchus ocellatus TaxID=259542 RepID=A0AAV3Z9I3_9GAST|nr:hypothetical protein PoB_001711400 [Plakobranchus ocellatus]